MDPNVLQRDQYVSMYRSGSCQNPFVMPGHGFVITSSPTAPRTGRPSSPKHSAAMPGIGPLNEHGLIGAMGNDARMPPEISVPPV